MPFTYRTEQLVPYPVAQVFAFFADPANLPRLMPPWQDARIDASFLLPPPGAPACMAGPGSEITLSFRPFPAAPFRLSWDAEITEFVLNSHFTDRQVCGPFASWNHTHRVLPAEADGSSTRIFDEVVYEPPMGPLGRLANMLFLRSQLHSTFAYRQQRVAVLLSQHSTAAV